jgi:uncharacterized protein (DUF1697 family)
MLRGINVSGQNIIRMEDLRRICTKLGFRNVETYGQSGNAVFLAKGMPPSTLANHTTAALRDDLGLSVPVLIKTVDEIGDVVAGNPFPRETGIDVTKLHVTFLSAPVPARALKNLEALPKQSDQFRVGRREIYLYCPDGYGRTKLSNAALEKALSVVGTTRNWRTVTALLDKASRMR